MTHRLFTAKEANATLPLVRRIVADILTKGERFRGFVNRPLSTDEIDAAQDLKEEIDTLIGELEEIGCSYKDWNFEMGLVDFPGIVDGQPVLLCWRSDEDSLVWYHAPEAGFAGRVKIPSMDL